MSSSCSKVKKDKQNHYKYAGLKGSRVDYMSQAPPWSLPPAYLCCALTLRCGDPAQHKLPQQQRRRRGARHKKFLHRNGQVSEDRFSSLFHVRDPHNDAGLDIRTDGAEKPHQIWDSVFIHIYFFGDFSLFGFAALHPKTKPKRGVLSWKCVPLRCLAASRGLRWFFCCFWGSSVDLLLARGRVPLPARVLGSFWTAVGWKGAKFQTRSRSGQFNCESS